ncbi:hypothetical protein M758_11G154600 [Ceratodon purpureus]|nr:hypothetical protein M758_11G154600 [Ceratodon purpureus]
MAGTLANDNIDSEGVKKGTAWQRFKKKGFRMKMLIWWTLGGVALGIIIGAALYGAHPSKLAINLIGYPGELLIRALQELVLPLMVFALMSGVFNLRHSGSGTGRIIRWSLLYYLLSMILAVILGIALVYAIKPGRDKPFAGNNFASCNANVTATGAQNADKSAVDSLLNIGRSIIPTNIVAAAAAPNFLGVITFAIVFAAALLRFGERAEPLINILEICNDVFMKIIYAVIACTPIGVASLLASTILKSCSIISLLKALALYVATVLGGFIIHSTILLPITLMVLSQNNPFKVIKSFLPALAVGVGTSSSAATMPVTMKCGEDHGCEPSIVRFVVPMGTNVNRDGAALYEAVSVIFIVQAHGLSLTPGNVIVVALTATLAAIGSASIPNSALVSMITVLQALSLQEYIPDVAVLYSVDWLLGMIRTATNIWGDACACVVVDTWARRHARKHGLLPIKNPEPPTSTEMGMGMDSSKKDGIHHSDL